jgi:hypothetical protein
MVFHDKAMMLTALLANLAYLAWMQWGRRK